MSAQLDAILAGLDGTIEDAVPLVTLEVNAALIEACPVDTGNARANFIAGIGDGVPDAELEQSAAEAAQSAGLAAILGFKLADGVCRIRNNVGYLENLIAGSSSQAPAGWDRVAIESGVAAAVAKAAGS